MHVHDCRHLLEDLSDYVDGEASAELCAEIERHLGDCDNCRVVLNTTRRTIDLVHAPAENPDLPDDVRERLFKRLNLDNYMNQKS